MKVGIVHSCRAASAITAPSVVISFMSETGDHDVDAEDFIDVALVHHAAGG